MTHSDAEVSYEDDGYSDDYVTRDEFEKLCKRVEAVEGRAGNVVQLDTTTDNEPKFLSEGARGDLLLADSIRADQLANAQREYDLAVQRAGAAGLVDKDGNKIAPAEGEPKVGNTPPEVHQTANGPVEFTTSGRTPGGDLEPADIGASGVDAPPNAAPGAITDPDFQNEPATNDMPAPEQAAVDAAGDDID